MIMVNNKQVKGMYYQKNGGTSPMLLNLDEDEYSYISTFNMRAGDISPDDISYPVKRAYYNGHLVYEKNTPTPLPTEPPIDTDTRARVEITSDVDLTSNGSMYIQINGVKRQATETKTDSHGRTVYVYPITSNITTLKSFMDSEASLGYNNSSTCNFYLVEFKNCDDKIVSSSTFSLQGAFKNPRIHEIKGINWNLETIASADNCFLRCNMLRGVLDISNWKLNCVTNGWFAITTGTNTSETLTIYADNLQSTTWNDWGFNYNKHIVIYCTQATKTAMSRLYSDKDIVYKVLPAEDDRYISKELINRRIEPSKEFLNYNEDGCNCNLIETYKCIYKDGSIKNIVEMTVVYAQTLLSGLDNLGDTDIEETIYYGFGESQLSTTITKRCKANSVLAGYTVDLNNHWRESSVKLTSTNPTIESGVYESNSNYNVHNQGAISYIEIEGYIEFTIYINSYGESNYDYVMVSNLDKTITNSTSYNDALVKAHTRGKSLTPTVISNFTKVTFTGIDGGKHKITIIYRKDGSGNSSNDRGYFFIPVQQ